MLEEQEFNDLNDILFSTIWKYYYYEQKGTFLKDGMCGCFVTWLNIELDGYIITFYQT
jgi:hypothetical protein